jgi:DNA polymerase III subunit delta
MHLPPQRIAAFLDRPDPEIRAVLFYGPDSGLVRERADRLARSVCAELTDPFRVAELSGPALAEDPPRLADEAAQLSLAGGRRVVRVRGAGDGQAPLFAGFLDIMPGEALVVVEAGELARGSPLRRAFEQASRAAAIGCYPDGARERAQVIREVLGGQRITVSRDAVNYLVEHLGGDRLLTRAELEKLTLYAGAGGRIELDDARLSVGDSAALDLDDAVMAAAEGDAVRLERVLARIFQEGASPVTVVRAVLRHLQRLHPLAALVAAGTPAAEALRNARPPVFFKHEDSFRRQLEKWSEIRLRRALDCLAAAELAMKQTGFPAETLCREALSALVLAACGADGPSPGPSRRDPRVKPGEGGTRAARG